MGGGCGGLSPTEGVGGDDGRDRTGGCDLLAGVVELLAVAADRLREAQSEPLEGEALGEALVALHVQEQRLGAGLARLADRFRASGAWSASGARSAGSWLAFRCRSSKAEVDGRLRLGRDLRTLPAVDAAAATGEINLAHVRILGNLARTPRLAVPFAHAQADLIDHARTMDWPSFWRTIDYWRYAADPDGAERTAADDNDARQVHLNQGLRGTGLLHGELTPVCRETVSAALERIHDQLFEAEWSEARERLGREPAAEDLPRTRPQRLHDALQEMAVRASSAPVDAKRPEPLLSVLVGLDTFHKICELDSGQVITPGQAAPLLDRALIERIVFDAPSRVTDISQARTFRGALRRAIVARDRECQHPGCHVPARWCQVDHIHPHAQGGDTIETNGQLLCGFHNRWKHRQTVRQPPNST